MSEVSKYKFNALTLNHPMLNNVGHSAFSFAVHLDVAVQFVTVDVQVVNFHALVLFYVLLFHLDCIVHIEICKFNVCFLQV